MGRLGRAGGGVGEEAWLGSVNDSALHGKQACQGACQAGFKLTCWPLLPSKQCSVTRRSPPLPRLDFLQEFFKAVPKLQGRKFFVTGCGLMGVGGCGARVDCWAARSRAGAPPMRARPHTPPPATSCACSESFAGHYVPAVASKVFHASQSGEAEPPINLQVWVGR